MEIYTNNRLATSCEFLYRVTIQTLNLKIILRKNSAALGDNLIQSDLGSQRMLQENIV